MAPVFPGGTMKCMPQAAYSSTILKPLSATILLYLKIMSKIYDFSVIALSLILPVYAFEINVITEFGVTQTKNFSDVMFVIRPGSAL